MPGKNPTNLIRSVCLLPVLALLAGCSGGNGDSGPLLPPAVSPTAGDYTKIFRISLSPASPGDEIHYTLDGTPPSVTSTKYVNPIPVVSDGATVGVRAIAVRGGSTVSQEVAASWTLHFGFSASATVRDAGPATVDGVCVSTYDGTIDWAQVKAGGTAFAYIRAMDGTTKTDARFAANWAAAKSAGVLRAPYQFFEPDQDPVQQADAFLSMFMLGDGDLPPLLDVELSGTLTPAECAGRIAQWVARVEEVTGRVPAIYSTNGFWITKVGGCTAFRDLPLMVAHWGVPSPLTPDAWATWTFWHYTDNGTVPGFTANANRVFFNGTAGQLQALAH